MLVLDLCEVYLATAGADNKVTIWNTFTGSIKAKMQLPKRNPGIYVTGVRFLRLHHNYFIVTQSNGDLYVIDPISAEITVKYENMLEEQSILDVNHTEKILISINELG